MTVESNETWYWLRPDRQQVSGSIAELRELLAARSLPRSTLVWSEPWPEWLAASDVPALADAIPKAPPRPASQPPRPGPPPLNRRNRLASGSERPRPKVPLPRPPKVALPRRDAATEPAPSRELPRGQGVPRPPLTASPKAEAFLNSLSRKPPTHRAVEAEQPEVAAPAARDAAPFAAEAPANASAQPLESPKLEAASGTPAALASAQPTELVTLAPSELVTVPPTELVTLAPSELVTVAPGAENRENAARREEDAESKAAELETVPLTAPVEELRPPAALEVALPEPSEAQPQLEVSAQDIVSVESAPRASEEARDVATVEASEPAASSPGEPSEPLTLPPDELVTQAADEAVQTSTTEAAERGAGVEAAEESHASDQSVHGPASTAGFFPAQPRRVLTSSDAPVELRSADEASGAAPGGREGRRAKTALWAVSSVCAVLALALGLSVRALRTRPAAAVPQANVPAAPQPTPKAFECRIATPAAKLSADVERGVEPTFSPIDEGRVAVGFASAPNEAKGIVVNLDTLSVSQAFEEKGDARVSQVNAAPGEPARFSAQREALDFASPRALETQPSPSELGVTKEGVVVRRGTQTKLLWPLAAGHGAEPRAARLADGSYRVALRRGGAEGELLVGRLGPEGDALGPLVAVETGVRQIGTPAIGAHKDRAFVVFAGRDQKTEPFRLRAAALAADASNVRAEDVRLGAAEGKGAIAPFLSPVGDERWLLQWTEGDVGRYRVFVQSLNAELRPEGEPIAVSPMGANAGQGLVRVFGDKALSLFVLPVPGHDELWGAVLACR